VVAIWGAKRCAVGEKTSRASALLGACTLVFVRLFDFEF